MTGSSFLKVSLVAVGLAMTVAVPSALAFHPGAHSNPAVPPDPGAGAPPDIVPQGPYHLACENQGRWGIDIAILSGGQVHCEEEGGGEEGGSEGGDLQ
jgi:hypothetical protein